jgi:hypothetical protein
LSASVSFGASTYQLLLSNAAPYTTAGIITNGSVEGFTQAFVTNAINNINDPYDAGVSVNLEARSLVSTLVFSRWGGTLAAGMSASEVLNPIVNNLYVNGNGSLIANYTNKINLVVSSANPVQGGTIPVSGSTTGIPLGRAVYVTAVPNAAYDFAYWTKVGNITITDTNSAIAEVTATAPGGSFQVNANFKAKRLLTITTVGGTGVVFMSSATVPIVATNKYYFSQGDTVTLSAYGASGDVFKKWSANVADPLSTPTTITMANDTVVTVEFGQAGKQLIVLSSPGGTVSPSGTNQYNLNAAIEISATASNGFAFSGWTKVNGGPVDPAKRLANPASYIMDMDRDFKATFANAYTLTVYQKTPGQAPYVLPPIAAGSYVSYTESNQYVNAGVDTRYAIVGFTGTGDVPATGTDNKFDISSFGQNSSVTWTWQLQYLLRAANTNVALIMVEGWKLSGTTHPVSVDVPDGYKISYWLINGAQLLTNSATIQVLMDGPKQVGIVFASNNVDEDSDGDGLPDWYELQFGLDPNNGNNLDGRFGDPDRDGLDNYTEFRLCATNASVGAKYMDPLNCDTDNDGMDDGYENKYFDVLRQIPTDTSEFISAALLDTTPYGTDDNPDLDTWWSTNTGFQLLDVPLRNIEEYIGPDQQGPTFYNVPASEWATYFPGSTDYPARKKTMKVKLVNASDTGDYSNPANPQTDADGMDDGFEYTWDVWQQNQQGDPIQTKWVKITGTVPAWPGSRYFHPRVAAGTGSDQLLPDYDWLYYTNTAQVRSEFSSYQESIASVFSASNGAFAVNRGSVPWCTNPFLWDTDGDGLPDGWELSFGFNPWVAGTDAIANPDGDAMAAGGGLYHDEVYATNGFNPNVAWLPDPNPGNWYDNTFEFLGTAVLGTGNSRFAEPHWTRASAAASYGTHPRNVDTDFDGLFDGWELYLGLDPGFPADAGGNADGPPETLVNWQEFMGRNVLAHWIGRIQAGGTPNAILPAWTNFIASWPNKALPTNPYEADTDHDQMLDSAEQTAFNYSQGVAGAGGGLDPCSVDTDLDYLPDAWENYWAGAGPAGTNTPGAWTGGMNGTVSDALLDYDGDGLWNYQEYLVGACYQFQWLNNGGDYGLADPYGSGWDPYDFFDVALSGGGNGEAMTGSGALGAHAWDPAYWADRMAFSPYKRFTFLSGAVVLGALNFSTCNPGDTDTDSDGYDDFYEIYHNLNPIRGAQDRVSGKMNGVTAATDLLYLMPYGYSTPFRWGELPLDPVGDFDQDGQVDLEEGLTPNLPAVIPYHHSDPSPYFVADISSDGSWVNKYYKTGWVFGGANYWYWDDRILLDQPGMYASAYLFTFEVNEGYDTDNDLVMDGVEIVGDTPGATDPLDEDSPLRQRALYLDGGPASAARLYAPIINPWSSFRGFTIEAWVCPGAIDGDRVVVERSGPIVGNNPGDMGTAIHSNFRLGLTNGLPYIGYDGYGQSWVYNVVMSTPNYRLAVNRWAHLAGVFDAQNKRLTLYVDGEMAGSKTTQQIPFNGFVAGDVIGYTTPLVIPMNLTVGAADRNPEGVCDGSRGTIKSGWHRWFVPLANSFPSFTNRFKGWIDEVRCWDGARTREQIRAIRGEKLTRRMVNAINGVSTGDQNIYGGMGGTEINPRLVYAYTFDALPDPRQGIVPQGYELAVFPSDWPQVEWWGTFPMASSVYANRKYVKWIQNMASHQPYDPPRDSRANRWRTFYTNASPGGPPVVITNFPNTANPYVFEYVHAPLASQESHPQYTSADSGLYGDLLPLGSAQGDDDATMWDDADSAGPLLRDQDGDGMPDTWETQVGLDPFDPADADDDPDGDGLTNQQEYQVGGNPYGMYSLDPNKLIPDSGIDTDGDGLANGEEIIQGTHLQLPDTDDDGLLDGAEVQDGTDPTFSLSPAISRVLHLDGGSSNWLEGPTGQDRFLMNSFTVGAWIRPEALGGTVLSSEPDPGIYNFRLLIRSSGKLAVEFTSFDRATVVSLESPLTSLIPTGIWTHVAASFNSSNRKLILFYNGREVASLFAITTPAVFGYGPSRVRAGIGFSGEIDEVALFNAALPEDRIAASMNGPARLGLTSLVAYYPFDDGTHGLDSVSGHAGWNSGHVQDFAVTNNDWMSGWKNGATFAGGAAVVGGEGVSDTGSGEIIITGFTIDANHQVTIASVGSAGTGWQYLQCNTSMLATNSWFSVATNSLPLPWPDTNWWNHNPVSNMAIFYRIIQK